MLDTFTDYLWGCQLTNSYVVGECGHTIPCKNPGRRTAQTLQQDGAATINLEIFEDRLLPNYLDSFGTELCYAG